MNKIILLSIVSISSLVAMEHPNLIRHSKTETVLRFPAADKILPELDSVSAYALKQTKALEAVEGKTLPLSLARKLIDDAAEKYNNIPEKRIHIPKAQLEEAKRALIKRGIPTGYIFVKSLDQSAKL